MDSFSLQFGSMNSLDLQPLSYEVSRLSPAKSTSSIDQFTHHHGKGDSAYSSFSGCSNAPDYASPFLSDELNPHSLPYTDLKYVKAVYNPNILNNNNPKSMDQLFKSVQAISQHRHCQDSSLSGLHRDRKLSPPLLPPPPTPPARLDSFITTKNMEDYKTKVSPDSQSAEKSHRRSSVHNPGRAHPRHDPVCGRRISQPNLEDPVGQGGLDQTQKQSQFPSSLSQFSPTAVLLESRSENQRKRSRSDHVLSSAEKSARDVQHAKQNVISNIQHKGQYYFVTGVSSDSSFRNSLSSVAEGESMHSVSKGPQTLVEVKVRSHSCTDNVNRGVRRRHWSSNDLQGGTDVCCQSLNAYTKKQDVESRRRGSYSPSYISKQEFRSLDSLDEKATSSDMGLVSHRRHSSSHHIFYCGPEDSTLPATHSDKDMTPTVLSTEQEKDDNAERLTMGMTWSLGDLPSDKISKESTPLLYHLTGASTGALMNWPKNSGDANETQRETQKSTASLRQWSKEERNSSSSGDSNSVEQSSTCRVDLEQRQDALGSSTGTLDDSFKKYYKEKLKDAQSKVLRETSFRRKDLLLSWPHGVKQRPEPQLSALVSVITHRDLKATFVSPANSDLGPEAMGKENRNENKEEEEKGKENGKPSNFPQPQVARIGSRRRLVAEQKKLCYSEPEKLHQVGAAPLHVTCSSLGNEKEVLLSHDESSEEGLVASRKKMFETRNSTFSRVAKNTLKQIQIKALVAYMERKIGHKTAEPQQPPPAHRHSTAGKPREWVLRPLSGNVGPRTKLLRPHSAGSCAKGSQFGPIQSFQEPPQSIWKEFTQPAKGLFASTECLLDLPEQAESPQACPTSTAQTWQNERNIEELSLSFTEKSGLQMKAEGETRMNKSRVTSVPVDQRIRSVALRGKSMEELGVALVNTTSVLSRSSEQLAQLSPGREKRVILFREEQKQAQLCAHKNLLVKQDSAPELTGGQGSDTAPSGAPETAEAPATSSPSRARSLSVTTGPTSPSSVLPNIVGNNMFYTGNIRPIFSLNRFLVGEPSKTTPSSPCSPATSSTLQTAVPSGSLPPELSARHQTENLRFDSKEVSLSCGVTTDPSSWFAPKGKQNKNHEEHHSSPGDSSTAEVLNPSPVPECIEPPAAQSTPPAVTHVVEIQSADYNRPQKEEHKDEELPVSAPETLEDSAAKGEPQWEELVEEVVAEDQSLARVLLPVSNRKTAVMLMEQLLSEDTLLMEEHYRKKHEHQISSLQQAEERYVEGDVKPPDGGNVDLKFKTQKTGRVQNKGGDVTEKKRALIACIEGGLRAIEVQRATLHDEVRANTLRGGAVDALVQKSCLPAEYERYTLFVGDLERVVSLLLCLSARLARVQNALSAVGDHADAEEKQSLDNRHRLLCKQRKDAKDLKDNLDRRERVVSTILARHLTAEQLQDYRHFIQTTAALLIRQKDLDERKRLWEEQLESLLNSISP